MYKVYTVNAETYREGGIYTKWAGIIVADSNSEAAMMFLDSDEGRGFKECLHDVNVNVDIKVNTVDYSSKQVIELMGIGN